MPVVELGLGAVGERDLRGDRDAIAHLYAAGAGPAAAVGRRVTQRGPRRRVGSGERLLDGLVVAVGLGQEAFERHPERRL
jgi:hypothetical protein